MVENRIRFSGAVTDAYGKVVEGAKVIFSDSKGVPVQHNGSPIGTITDASGNWGLQIPSSLLRCVGCTPFITARYTGLPSETVSISEDVKNVVFILGAKVQEEQEMIVVGQCKTLSCKVKSSFARNKKAYIIGIIGLVLLAVAMTLIFARKKTA